MIDHIKYPTLFLDRDGVINKERKNDYVKNINEFIFIKNSLSALAILSKKFEYIFIVTNQRGIGKGLMTFSDLNNIHNYMMNEIIANRGRITDIYICPDIDSTSINRKPNIGMAFHAQQDYPSIKFKDSIFVGNSLSDIHFGNKLGMQTILVGDKYSDDDPIYNIITHYYTDLYQFALSL